MSSSNRRRDIYFGREMRFADVLDNLGKESFHEFCHFRVVSTRGLVINYVEISPGVHAA